MVLEKPEGLTFGFIRATFAKYELAEDKKSLDLVGFEGSWVLTPELTAEDNLNYIDQDLITLPAITTGELIDGRLDAVNIASNSKGSTLSEFTYKLEVTLKGDKPIVRTITGIYLPAFNGNNAVNLTAVLPAGPGAPEYIGNNDPVIAAILADPDSASYAAVLAIVQAYGVAPGNPEEEGPGVPMYGVVSVNGKRGILTGFAELSDLSSLEENIFTRAPKASPSFTGNATAEKLAVSDDSSFAKPLTIAKGTAANHAVTKEQLDAAQLGGDTPIDLSGYQKSLPKDTAPFGKVLASTDATGGVKWVNPPAGDSTLDKVDNTADKDKIVSDPQEKRIKEAEATEAKYRGGSGASSAITLNGTAKVFTASDLGKLFRCAVTNSTSINTQNPTGDINGLITLVITKTNASHAITFNSSIKGTRPDMSKVGTYWIQLAWSGVEFAVMQSNYYA